MKRKVVKIDEEKCNGCGLCIPNCPEGAIQINNGKARLVGELLCDGLGACVGNCPEGAISVEDREADAFDERRVMENVFRKGDEVVVSHLKHLEEHEQHESLHKALEFLNERNLPAVLSKTPLSSRQFTHNSGCPGTRSVEIVRPSSGSFEAPNSGCRSELTHWPIQLHLISPIAPHFQGRDVALAADCVAYAMGDFHGDYLKGHALTIACPRLDEGQERYLEKITALIEQAQINTLTVLIMQVPCCQGLLRLAQVANSRSSRKVLLKSVVVSLRGEVLEEQWLSEKGMGNRE